MPASYNYYGTDAPIVESTGNPKAGMIAGIVIGSFLFLLIVVVVIVCILRKNKGKIATEDTPGK